MFYYRKCMKYLTKNCVSYGWNYSEYWGYLVKTPTLRTTAKVCNHITKKKFHLPLRRTNFLFIMIWIVFLALTQQAHPLSW